MLVLPTKDSKDSTSDDAADVVEGAAQSSLNVKVLVRTQLKLGLLTKKVCTALILKYLKRYPTY